MPPTCLGPNTILYLIRVAGIIGGYAGGLQTTYRLMWPVEFNIRTEILMGYLTIFNLLILSAEFNLLDHPIFKKFGKFMTTFSGRAFFYVFIGGLILDGDVWYEYIPGVYMLCVALLNIIALCCWGNYLEGATKGGALPSSAAPPDTPSSNLRSGEI